jgi:hypothetical protein
MSGCERNLTCQSTEVEQQTQVAGINVMLRDGCPALPEKVGCRTHSLAQGNEDAACVLDGGVGRRSRWATLLAQPASSDDASNAQ